MTGQSKANGRGVHGRSIKTRYAKTLSATLKLYTDRQTVFEQIDDDQLKTIRPYALGAEHE